MKKILISIALFVSTVFAVPATSDAAAKDMKVHFIDVGQGDAIYIKAPGGEDILIDAGRNGKVVVDYLKKLKVDDIEILISTHPDADHVGGLDEVLKAYKVEKVYAPKVSHTTQAYKDFLLAVKNNKTKNLKINTATKGTKLSISGVTATFVGPVKSYDKDDLNNWSAVLKVTYGKKSFLFTGDAETLAENDLIKSKQSLNADVIKVGHHGAKTSTSTAFLNAVKPTYAVISVGKNSYGHPTASALTNLKKGKVNVFRTDKQGSIIATTNGTKLTFNTKPSTSAATTTTTATTAKLTATLDNTKPAQNGTVNLMVKGLPNGTAYKAVFNYKSTTTVYTGKVGTKLPVRIGRAAKGFKVVVNVTASSGGKSYKATTGFTPQ